MFKGTITDEIVTSANTNIPLTVQYNTNGNTSYSSSIDAISIRNPGFYDVEAQFVLTDVAVGDISVQMYADGNPIPEAIATGTSGNTTNFITLPLTDKFRVVATSLPEHAKLSFRTSVAATISAGVVTIERVR